MNAKITWFEELLAAEPNSKFFFPLAQAYVQTNRDADAIAVLHKGLSFHPEHLEARLLLIQCLERGDNRSQADAQVKQLASSLTACPSFWDLWAEQCASAGQDSLGLTLSMLSRLLQGADLDWGQVLEHGLRAMSAPGAHSQHAPSRPAQTETNSPSEQEQDARQPTEQQPTKQQPTKQQDENEPAPHSPEEPAPEPADAASLPMQTHSATTDADQEPSAALHESSASDLPLDSSPELSEGERKYYETKTYGQLLADQGESAEALDLYTKLLQSTPDETQRQELEDRIDQLRETLANKATGQPQDAPATQHADQSGQQQPEQSASKPKAKAPLASEKSSGTDTQQKPKDKGAAKTLERLAQRLEDRARPRK